MPCPPWSSSSGAGGVDAGGAPVPQVGLGADPGIRGPARAARAPGGRLGQGNLVASPGYPAKKNVLRAFKAIVKRANDAETARATAAGTEPDLTPPAVRFHDLRHTHASGLIADNCSIKAVSRRLGHADVTITLRVYAHLMPDD